MVLEITTELHNGVSTTTYAIAIALHKHFSHRDKKKRDVPLNLSMFTDLISKI